MMNAKNIFKTLALAMLLPAMLFTSACSNINENEEPVKKGFILPVTVNVTRQGDDSATKTTYSGNTLSFSPGDQLFVDGNDDGGVGYFAGTLTWVSGNTFRGAIITENTYGGTPDALFTAANSSGYVEAILLPYGYGDYGYLSIVENDGYDAELQYVDENALVATKDLAVEQFSDEYAEEYSGGFTLKPRNAIFNFTISGLTAAQTNVGVSLTGPSGLEVTGSVPTDESGKAAFAVGAYKSSGARLKAFDLTVGGKSIPLMLSSDLEIQAGTIYNIARSPLSNAFVKGNETSFAFTSFMGGLTLAATYSGSSFGYVTKGGALADYVSTASMAKEGNNLVVSIAVTGLGSGSMTIDTASSTYKWSSGTAGNYITLNSITIGGQPIMPLPELQ